MNTSRNASYPRGGEVRQVEQGLADWRPTDLLTGAASREYLFKELPREYARCRRYSHPLALALFDIDRLKLINDGFGRDAGDEVLRAFHVRAVRTLRYSDWVARKEGDEFVVVMPETDLAGAAVVAERICRAMAGRPISSAAGAFGATVSVGYCAVTNPAELARLTCEDLLLETGKQWRAAVAAGRNGISGAEAQPALHTDAPATGRHRLTRVPAPDYLTLIDDEAAASGHKIPPH